MNGPLPPFIAFQKNGLTITLNIIKQASAPNITAVTVVFTNSQMSPLTNFEFKVAVPKVTSIKI